ncbi:hypothetical protein ANN_26292 [Periplaneta americana]|uniref:Uncharacterized protein n=1 Tax=Periplaneta americana TaxID=6978 RepID=A0ABQ8S5T8_PERAM|nr:hypothetical protein ANN_26292 [Periplaneta americana]
MQLQFLDYLRATTAWPSISTGLEYLLHHSAPYVIFKRKWIKTIFNTAQPLSTWVSICASVRVSVVYGMSGDDDDDDDEGRRGNSGRASNPGPLVKHTNCEDIEIVGEEAEAEEEETTRNLKISSYKHALSNVKDLEYGASRGGL